MYIFIFFAKADLVRDLRPLALPCCSNDYGGAKSGGKRISLRKGEIWRQQSVQNSTSKQEFMYMHRSAEEYVYIYMYNLCIYTCISSDRQNWMDQ